ncbi:MAG TPA: MlaD family protein [Solirubrobacteraceae bacterium]|nr:MlaD family protein [Solirubrobacteraceae bacterium]
MKRILGIGLLAVALVAVVVLGARAFGGDDDGGYKVRAIFDNAFTVIPGEDVRISGVNVGKIDALEVTRDNRAAVVLKITKAGFQDFRQDASCMIRPQSLIGERFVECSLTKPRQAGEQAPPPLKEIPDGEEGAGQLLLPVTNTVKPVDIDLINNVTRLPERQRLAIILNELGAGLAGRGEDLNETIRRANPALGTTNRVLKILADQNQVLSDLAENSDEALGPLADDRESVASFIEEANDVSRATADRRADLERNFELLPRFLRELRPTMTRLEGFADEFEPVLDDLGDVAPQLNQVFQNLGPFSEAGTEAITSLGEAAEVGRPALQATRPITQDLRGLFQDARPVADDLEKLTTSLRDTGGIERLMDVLFFTVASTNGYDELGHYVRAGLLVNTCTTYVTDPQGGCSARWSQQDTDAETAQAASVKAVQAKYATREAQSTNVTPTAAGQDQSAEAVAARGAAKAEGSDGAAKQEDSKALALPKNVLPGDDAKAEAPKARTSSAGSGAISDEQAGLLDYLLGGNK